MSGKRPHSKPSIAPVAKNAPILITGSEGFIGRNLRARLTAVGYENLLLFDLQTSQEVLEEYTQKAAFVFHLAGVNRPEKSEEFYEGNAGLTERLLQGLEKAGNKAPVLLSSSAQAGNGTDYAKSKEQAEKAVFEHGRGNGGLVFVYRLPGVFGKWCRPNYNSVVATFCHNIAHGLDIEIHDAEHTLTLCYIDDVVDSFIGVLEGHAEPAPLGLFFGMRPVYRVRLGDLSKNLYEFKTMREGLETPDLSDDFLRKLYATYLSYLPREDFSIKLDPKTDERGSFTEFLRTPDHGQVSVNVTKPGITKGNHWHDTKNEVFYVVSGQALIRFRKIGEKEVFEYRVSGEDPKPVDIPPGYTHSIQNVGQGDLVTLMWASELFDPNRPDTYYEEV
ncbi:NAD-dependent epimerase/dehydratase family protein [Ruminococcaceae bacterium OttesenSCG-928-I18]|nr:NAD-dependent epimerase/dehydratase family protein [Ruminococcaceae bacterium OttesenSCG-928-I18]